jgi:uncharacterized protein (UPF0335 family)
MAIINYKGINLITVGFKQGPNVIVIPGINEMPNDVYEKFKQHPSVKARIADGKIQIIDEQKAVAERTENEMVEHMSRIFDTKLLRKLIKEDKRDAVVNAAKAQLETIVGDPKKTEKKEEDEHFK